MHIHGRQSKKSGATWWQPYLSIYLSVRLSRFLSSCPSDDLSIHIRFILFHSISSQRWHVIQRLKTSPSPSLCHPDDDTTNTDKHKIFWWHNVANSKPNSGRKNGFVHVLSNTKFFQKTRFKACFSNNNLSYYSERFFWGFNLPSNMVTGSRAWAVMSCRWSRRVIHLLFMEVYIDAFIGIYWVSLDSYWVVIGFSWVFLGLLVTSYVCLMFFSFPVANAPIGGRWTHNGGGSSTRQLRSCLV